VEPRAQKGGGVNLLGATSTECVCVWGWGWWWGSDVDLLGGGSSKCQLWSHEHRLLLFHTTSTSMWTLFLGFVRLSVGSAKFRAGNNEGTMPVGLQAAAKTT